MTMGCVYQAKNKINGMCYIGKTLFELNYRKRKHIEASNRNSPYYFHRALGKYDPSNFEWVILFVSNNDLELCEYEKYFIKTIGTMLPKGYNLTKGGDGIGGYRFSEDTKRKMSLLRKGKKLSEETKAVISASKKGIPNKGHKGRSHSKETKVKISNSLKGRKNGPLSEELKKKLSIIAKKRYFKKLASDKMNISSDRKETKRGPMSDDTKMKISLARKGVKRGPMSEETKLKISIAKTWVKQGPLSKEHKEKISLSLIGNKRRYGKKASEETKKNISESLKGNRHALGNRHSLSKETRKKMSIAAIKRELRKKAVKNLSLINNTA